MTTPIKTILMMTDALVCCPLLPSTTSSLTGQEADLGKLVSVDENRPAAMPVLMGHFVGEHPFNAEFIPQDNMPTMSMAGAPRFAFKLGLFNKAPNALMVDADDFN